MRGLPQSRTQSNSCLQVEVGIGSGEIEDRNPKILNRIHSILHGNRGGV